MHQTHYTRQQSGSVDDYIYCFIDKYASVTSSPADVITDVARLGSHRILSLGDLV